MRLTVSILLKMIEISKLFPSKGSFIVFNLYIWLFVLYGVLVTASKSKDGTFNYDITSVVFLIELLKLVASSILYTKYKSNDKPDLIKAIAADYKLMLLYFVPSLLYCFYNNLAFINLSHYDPTTYYILLQFRVVITAVLFQTLFNKTLSSQQWVSLGILTIGCMVKNFDVTVINNGKSNIWSEIFSIYTITINVQVFCSCLAGTYNEYLLKTKGSNVDIFLQNVFMYLDSVICNFIIIAISDPKRIRHIFEFSNFYVIPIIVTSAAVGIVTSFFLKNLNSIIKTYASALELIISAVACYFLFNIPITAYTTLSICLVIVAVAMYLRNPVDNSFNIRSEKDEEGLLSV